MKTLMLATVVAFGLSSLPSCAALTSQGQNVQDCTTVHIKALSRGGIVDGTTYEKIVESCQAIYGGRPT